jgi:DNA uptake protein ComE-like DNA-binding protein
MTPACHDRRQHDTAPVLLYVLLVVAFGLAMRRTLSTSALVDAPPAGHGQSAQGGLIDPNAAAWWELTVLPGVGEVTARKIVEYREARRKEIKEQLGEQNRSVFTCPADLKKVHGIGPKKVARMAPYLTFGGAQDLQPRIDADER